MDASSHTCTLATFQVLQNLRLPYTGRNIMQKAELLRKMCIEGNRIRWNYFDGVSAPHRRVIVVSIVVLLHFAALTVWPMQPPRMTVPAREIEVTIAVPVAVVAEKPPLQPPPRVEPVQPPRAETPATAPLPLAPVVQQSNMPEVPPGEPAPVAATAPVVKPAEVAAPVVEPDYRAGYLNNQLAYPLAARRMGIQGRVVLNVEILADGVAGQINVQQSSGHEMLDSAALESIKSWRFVPARRAGQPFTKWFTIPITFSLKDNNS